MSAKDPMQPHHALHLTAQRLTQEPQGLRSR